MPSDAELLEVWRGGDAPAGEALLGRHFDAIYRFFSHKTGEDVSDLVQRTFLGLVEARERFRAEASVRTYLFAIARNVLKKHFEDRRKESVNFELSTLEDLAPSPSSLVRHRRTEALLVSALRKIPLDQQIALELHYWEGLSGSEVSTVLDIPEATVRSRLRIGIEKLRSHLESVDAGDLSFDDDESFETWAKSVQPYSR